MNAGSPLAPWMKITLLVVTVAFMLGGVAMIVTDVRNAVAFPAIGVAVALTAIIYAENRRHPSGAVPEGQLADLLEGVGDVIDAVGGGFTMNYATFVVTAVRPSGGP